MRVYPPDIENATIVDATAGMPPPPQGPSFPQAPTGGGPQNLDPATAAKLARECYTSSTNWLNAGRRAAWADSLRMFQNIHPNASKYLSQDYSYRSRHFRPKTRTIVRRAESQTAMAFFSNDDVVSIRPHDDDDPVQQASAEILQSLLQYRLTETIPWFLTLVGARQDAEVMGVSIAKVYWEYSERSVGLRAQNTGEVDDFGSPRYEMMEQFEVLKDEPVIDLIAPENFRFDPAADWRDPVGSSPYLIELIPMYVGDVMERCKSGEWNQVSESILLSAEDISDEATRRVRETGRIPGKDPFNNTPRHYGTAWVHSNILKWGGRDWQFYSLGEAGALLTDPRPLEEVFLHGVRPYVVGCSNVETHKSYPSSKVELVKDLQMMTNDLTNLRFDNVKLNLGPRQFIRQGQGVEINDVQRFNPGRAFYLKNPREDIVWDRPPEVTQSAYLEQDRINLDFDDLSGDFSNSSVQANQLLATTATGMNLMSGQAGGLNEYELRIFAETWVEPVLRQLVLLEQAYETDENVLAIAGKKANLFERFGMSQITDDLMQQELLLHVNVGIGSTNPTTRLRSFIAAGQALGQLFGPALPMKANFDEIAKEIFGASGYKDGARFFLPNVDIHQVMMQIAQGKSKPAPAAGAAGDPQANQTKLQIAQIDAASKAHDRQMAMETELRNNQDEYRLTQLQEQAENVRTFAQLVQQTHAAHTDRQHQIGMAQMSHGHQMQSGAVQHAQAQQTAAAQPQEGGSTGETTPPAVPIGPTNAGAETAHPFKAGWTLRHKNG